MSVLIEIEEAIVNPNLDAALTQAAVEAVLRRYSERPAADLTVTLATNETVAQLNAQHRGENKPTDVLSFANDPDPDFPDLTGESDDYWGDIIIAYPVAQAQAEAAGHRPSEEIILLAVHGALHIVGFDHDTPERKAEMWAAQAQILADLGLPHIQPTES